MLKGKKVLLGITGGIAAYKMCEFIRMLQKQGAQVTVVVTPSALNFVTKLTLQSLSKHKVFMEMFEDESYSLEHISLADDADLFIIAPASANTISKIAMGICDNLLTTIACAFKKPIILAPAMNCNMWENKIIQENLDKLEQIGYYLCLPDEGYLACGSEGAGRLCDLNKLMDKTVQVLTTKKKLEGKKIVITAGGTREKIDSVRFISNFSSGKMGLALADEAFEQGAEVVLITTRLPRPLQERAGVRGKYQVRLVESALDMKKAVEKEFEKADCLIMAAAVADYRAKKIADKKIKKTNAEEISVELVKNPDILKEICLKRRKNQLIIGFCAESENILEYAKSKIRAKGCDFLIANDISRSDIGFSSDYNEVYILDKKLNVKKINRAKKDFIAKQILETIYEN